MHSRNELIMISVDDHVVEPPTLFEGRLPAKFQDLAPRVERLSNGSDVWVFNGTQIPNIGLNAVAGRPKEEYGIEPTAFDEMRPGCFDIHERIKDMNAGGVLGSMNFPSFPGFSARLFAACRGQGPGARRYCGPTTTGTSTSGAAPIRAGSSRWPFPSSGTPELCAEEVRRVAAKGCHSHDLHREPG